MHTDIQLQYVWNISQPLYSFALDQTGGLTVQQTDIATHKAMQLRWLKVQFIFCLDHFGSFEFNLKGTPAIFKLMIETDLLTLEFERTIARWLKKHFKMDMQGFRQG